MNDPRIDAYIAGAPEFARPILEEVRKRMHAAVPGLEETMKWSSPHFSYNGGLFAGMAAFRREETRVKRVATAAAQLAEGKALYWKYEKK